MLGQPDGWWTDCGHKAVSQTQKKDRNNEGLQPNKLLIYFTI